MQLSVNASVNNVTIYSVVHSVKITIIIIIIGQRVEHRFTSHAEFDGLTQSSPIRWFILKHALLK